MKKKGRTSTKLHKLAKKDYVEKDVPRSFVIHQGSASSNLKKLMLDFKRLMKPNVAAKLMARKRNSLKDFVVMSGPLKVTHLIIFSQSESGLNLKISRLPQGPTLSFRIENYCLLKDVISTRTNNIFENKHSLFAPCLMTNLQPTEGQSHLQLCSKMFLDMFPTLSPSNIKASEINRCCLIHYDEDSELFNLRHYAIKVRPYGISKATRKILSNKIPNLNSYAEVSDFILKSEVLSDSEAENDSSNHIEIDKLRKGKVKSQKSVVKLSEIGPRLTLKLIKIEEGLCNGPVLFHNYITKTAEEKVLILKKRQKKLRLKQKLKMDQDNNIKKKEEKKESHREKCLKGMGIDVSRKRKREDNEDKNLLDINEDWVGEEGIADVIAKGQEDNDDFDDDAEYYREEVGMEPEKDLFRKRTDRGDKSKYIKYKKSSKARV